jgi:carbon storage regulator
MLVLSRRQDERIVIGEQIVITIVEIRGDKVRVGIEAPRDVPVHRREVYDAIQRHNAPSSSAPSPVDLPNVNSPDQTQHG